MPTVVQRLAGLEKTQCPSATGMALPRLGMVVVGSPTRPLGALLVAAYPPCGPTTSSPAASTSEHRNLPCRSLLARPSPAVWRSKGQRSSPPLSRLWPACVGYSWPWPLLTQPSLGLAFHFLRYIQYVIPHSSLTWSLLDPILRKPWNFSSTVWWSLWQKHSRCAPRHP